MVRTRFAPSPTGYMHIGNLRTALYEYLIAKSNNGKFILRIEDTDQERLVDGAIDVIYKTLKMAGLKHDEGPDIDSVYGPYIQSKRKPFYYPQAMNMIDQGDAYYCFCTKERLATLKEENERSGKTAAYDRHCLNLRPREIIQNLDNKIPYVIRQKMPREGQTVFHDAVYGTITVDNSELEDQILLKSDGFPTYNFANVVDDHMMKITHVVRGCEYLSSTPKYIRIYESLRWDIPTFIHLPIVTNLDGQKLSKRAGDASFEDLIEMGYLVEAVVNYIALLGWSPKDNQEIFTLDELIKSFNISGISKSPSAFDFVKLNYFNAEHLRRKTPEEFHAIVLPYIKSAVKNQAYDTRKIANTLQPRVELLTDIHDMITFYDELPEYETDLFINKKNKSTLETALDNLTAVSAEFSVVAATGWNYDVIHEILMNIVQRKNAKTGQVMWPIRVALSGRQVTPGGAVEIAEILGKDETLRRLALGLEKLKPCDA